MSANLARSAALAVDPEFRDLVRAAVAEHAINVVGIPTTSSRTPAQMLAARILYDPDGPLGAFVRAAANDDAISNSTDTPAHADLRRIVSGCWDRVAAVVPNLGA